MSEELERLEQHVERDMVLLHDLPAALPTPECLARIKARVAADAAHVRRRQRVWRIARPVVGVAAVAVLAIGLVTTGRRLPAGPEPGSEAAINEWAAAWDESSASVAQLLDGGWVAGFGERRDSEAELDDLLNSLDESLTQFRSL